MQYHISIKRSVNKELKKITKQDLEKIINKIRQLAQNPLPDSVVQLTNFQIEGLKFDKLYRIRAGDYRIIYAVEHDIITITVVRVKHRSEVYQ